ncbi:MAG: molybdenum cofactor biosynthesis protein B [Candidatus Woesearchaeota archaeon]
MCDKENCEHVDTSKQHKASAPSHLKFALVTVSTTKTKENDISGKVIAELVSREGHYVVSYSIVKDDKKAIRDELRRLCEGNSDVIIFTGGTGIAKSDVTIEAVRPFFEKELSSFSALFSLTSYNKIGSAAMLSRATAGTAKGKAVFCIPGSPRACRLALEKLILPEAGHIVGHVCG